MKHFDIIDELFEIGSIKFGSFKLKSGMITPFYIDLRLVISYPLLLQKIADALWEKVQHLTFKRICGVPYNALPIATAMCLKHQIPMLLKRKEMKDYGTKKIIEGVYEPHDECLLIEDVIVSGKSIFETLEPMQHCDINVSTVAVVVDREQGGRINIEKHGLQMIALFTVTDLFHHLRKKGKISQHDVEIVKKFIEHHRVDF